MKTKKVTTKQPKQVRFPHTDEEFEVWALKIINEFDLPNDEDVRDMLATAVLHLPQTVCAKELEYFASVINKSLANRCVFNKCGIFAKNRAEANAKAQAERQAAQAELKAEQEILLKSAETSEGNAENAEPVSN